MTPAPPGPSPPDDHVGERGAVLPLQPLQGGQPLLDLLQPGRRGVEAVGVVPQEEREVLELRLDAVPRLDMRLETGVHGSQVGDLPPDGAQAGQHGVVALVERGVALRAQPLEPLRAGEHLAADLQLFVFAGPGHDAVDLGQLEREQLPAGLAVGLLPPDARQQIAGAGQPAPGLLDLLAGALELA